jgi:hypothetical protein
MWEPQHLTTLWTSTACYRDTLTLYFIYAIAATPRIGRYAINSDVVWEKPVKMIIKYVGSWIELEYIEAFTHCVGSEQKEKNTELRSTH